MNITQIVIAAATTVVAFLFICLHHKKKLVADKAILILIGLSVAAWILPSLEREMQKNALDIAGAGLGGVLVKFEDTLEQQREKYAAMGKNVEEELNKMSQEVAKRRDDFARAVDVAQSKINEATNSFLAKQSASIPAAPEYPVSLPSQTSRHPEAAMAPAQPSIRNATIPAFANILCPKGITKGECAQYRNGYLEGIKSLIDR